MRRMYQTEWQGIRFAELGKLSSSRLADAAFYEKFYAELFRRYPGWDALDPAWRRLKEKYAEFVLSRIAPQASAVLSMGCGLGFMEHALHDKLPSSTRLHVHEIAPTALRWLAHEMPAEQVHLGPISEVLRDAPPFDLIYLCGVDYALDEREFADLLRDLVPHLKPGGELLVISLSFEQEEPLSRRTLAGAKQAARLILDRLGMRSIGQFWGWNRNREDYRRIFDVAGFPPTAEGRIEGGAYWIGCRAPA